jgi:hypothetical protein
MSIDLDLFSEHSQSEDLREKPNSAVAFVNEHNTVTSLPQ